jgi:opacity protein-like surface antigen
MKRIVAVALGLIASVAHAQPSAAFTQPGETYVTARLGAVVPQSSDLKGYDTGLAFEAAFGYRATPNFAFEGGIGRFAMSRSSTFYDPSIGTYTENDESSAIPFTFTVKAIAPTPRVDLYALAGAGVYLVHAKAEAVQSGFSLGSMSDDASSLAIHLGGGIAGRVSPNVSLGAELKYIIGSVKLFDVNGSFDSLIIAGSVNYHF